MKTIKLLLATVALGLLTLTASAQNWLTNGLVAYYPFNGNATDASGNGNNLSATNVQFLNSSSGSWLMNPVAAFENSVSYMIGQHSLLNRQTNWTWSAWVNPDSASYTNGLQILFCEADSTEAQTGGSVIVIGLNPQANQFDASSWNVGKVPNSWKDAQFPLTISPGFHHFALTLQNGDVNAGTLTFYMDGLPLGSTNHQSVAAIPGDPMAIALGEDPSFPLSGRNSANEFKGEMGSVRIYNRALSTNEVAELYAIESTPPCRSLATATATVVDGFVVAATITDGGCGYTNTPRVLIEGGGGAGAGATAAVSNGVLVGITITNAGIGYTNAPLIVIAPPFVPNPVLNIAPMSFLSFSNLTLGGVYQLQRSVAWYWSNQPVSFTATNALYTQMIAGVAGNGDYRLALNLVPAQAFATPQVVNGFVVGAAVTSGGSGYVTTPAVTIVGGGGTNAGAIANLSGGVVTSRSITNAGIGYTNTPTIRIASPPAAAVSPTVLPVVRVDSTNLAPYDNYQIQFKPALGGTWGNWNGGLFSPTDVTNSQYLFITNGAGFFRLQYVP